jgi:cis-3-alkyl-4-acyloxetan-2-one decarboxylase / olefin beta-lactone synthetase
VSAGVTEGAGLRRPGLKAGWSRFVTVADADGAARRWHLLDNGAEPVVGTMLCLHGNPTWSYLWRRFLAGAAAGWRVIAPDQLGMGYSERTEGPRTMAQRIDDLEQLTTALGITGPVVLTAHDWGGPIGLGWAERHVDQLVGIVLTNTGVAVPTGHQAPTLIRLARSRLLREAVCVRTGAFVRGAARLSRPALAAPAREGLRAPYDSTARRRAIGDFVADIPLEQDHPSRVTVEAVAAGLDRLGAVPILLLWGPRDPIFGEGYLRDLRRRLPWADVHRYAGGSHLLVEDRPQAAHDAWRWVVEQQAGPPAPAELAQTSEAPALGAALARRAADPDVAVAELGGQEPRLTSFGELHDRIAAVAGGLRRAGVRPADRVALLVRPGLDLTTVVYACWRIGAAIVIADAGLGLRRLADAVRSADPQWLVAVPAGLALAAAGRLPGRRIVAGSLPAPLVRAWRVEHSLAELIRQPPVVDAEPLADAEGAVLFTSGATGPPKGVVYRHRQLRAQLDLVRTVCRIGPDDRLVAAFAPFALYGVALGIGAAVPDMDVTRPGTLTARALAEAADAIEGTVVFASPAALRNVVATAGELTAPLRQALNRIRLVLSAGAPVSPALLRRVGLVMPNAELHTPYGMTEVLPVTDIHLREIEAAERESGGPGQEGPGQEGIGNGVCVGHPLPGVEVAISALDRDGAATGALTAAPATTGEICVTAPHLKERYDQLWATERAARTDRGWHRTGDVGHLDGRGRLWVEGRLVHVVLTAAGPVTPVAIEQRIEVLDPVTMAAVVGVGPAGVQQVVAVVSGPAIKQRGPLAEPELAAAVRAVAAVTLAAVLVATELPTDIRHQSKIDRQRLARWADRVLAGGPAGRP